MRTLAAVFSCMVAVGQAAGQPPGLSYEFATDEAEPQFTTAFEVQLGQKVGIRVYVRDNSPGAATLSANNGLGSAAVRLTTAAPTTGVVAVAAVSDIVPNTAEFGGQFDFLGTNARTAGPGSAAVTVGDFSPDQAGDGILPDALGRVLVATFYVVGLSEGAATVGEVDLNLGSGFDTSSFSGAGYDHLFLTGPFSATVTVTPVPEPVGLLLAAGVAAASSRRRAGRSPGVPNTR